MHQNLTKIQKNAVETMKDILEVFDCKNKKFVVVSAMTVAEKPLTKNELQERTGLPVKELEEYIEKLTNKGFLAVFNPDEKEARYEINPDLEKVMMKKIREKLEKILDIMERHIDMTKDLLETGKPEFDDYDLLMAKMLRMKLRKAWMVHHILSKKRILVNFLESGEVDKEEIKKISIE